MKILFGATLSIICLSNAMAFSGIVCTTTCRSTDIFFLSSSATGVGSNCSQAHESCIKNLSPLYSNISIGECTCASGSGGGGGGSWFTGSNPSGTWDFQVIDPVYPEEN